MKPDLAKPVLPAAADLAVVVDTVTAEVVAAVAMASAAAVVAAAVEAVVDAAVVVAAVAAGRSAKLTQFTSFRKQKCGNGRPRPFDATL